MLLCVSRKKTWKIKFPSENEVLQKDEETIFWLSISSRPSDRSADQFRRPLDGPSSWADLFRSVLHDRRKVERRHRKLRQRQRQRQQQQRRRQQPRSGKQRHHCVGSRSAGSGLWSRFIYDLIIQPNGITDNIISRMMGSNLSQLPSSKITTFTPNVPYVLSLTIINRLLESVSFCHKVSH